MPPMKDHYLVIYILIQVVNQLLHCNVYPQFNAGLRDKYPFVTYSWIDAGSNTTMDDMGEMEVTLQIDVQATDQYQALEMITSLHKALKWSYGYRRYFKQAHIIPHSVSGTNAKPSYGYGDVINDYWFECSFSLYDLGTIYKPEDLNFVFNESIIESIKAMNTMNGTSIKTSKEDK